MKDNTSYQIACQTSHLYYLERLAAKCMPTYTLTSRAAIRTKLLINPRFFKESETKEVSCKRNDRKTLIATKIKVK